MKLTHSPLLSAKVTNEWSYTSVPPICLHDADMTFALFFNVDTSVTSVIVGVTDRLILRKCATKRPLKHTQGVCAGVEK